MFRWCSLFILVASHHFHFAVVTFTMSLNAFFYFFFFQFEDYFCCCPLNMWLLHDARTEFYSNFVFTHSFSFSVQPFIPPHLHAARHNSKRNWNRIKEVKNASARTHTQLTSSNFLFQCHSAKPVDCVYEFMQPCLTIQNMIEVSSSCIVAYARIKKKKTNQVPLIVIRSLFCSFHLGATKNHITKHNRETVNNE